MHIASSARIFRRININDVIWDNQIDDLSNLSSGDIVKVRVIKEGRFPLNRLETLNGEEKELAEGDVFVGVIGSRAALDFLTGSPPNRMDDCIYTLNIGGVLGKIDDLNFESTLPPEVRVIARGLLSNSYLNTIDMLLHNNPKLPATN